MEYGIYLANESKWHNVFLHPINIATSSPTNSPITPFFNLNTLHSNQLSVKLFSTVIIVKSTMAETIKASYCPIASYCANTETTHQTVWLWVHKRQTARDTYINWITAIYCQIQIFLVIINMKYSPAMITGMNVWSWWSHIPDTASLQHRHRRTAVQETSICHQPSLVTCSAMDWQNRINYQQVPVGQQSSKTKPH